MSEQAEDPRLAMVRGLLPPPEGSGIFVTVRDSVTGEEQTVEVPADDYVLIPVGKCHLANTAVHANGTHVLTLKGRRGL